MPQQAEDLTSSQYGLGRWAWADERDEDYLIHDARMASPEEEQWSSEAPDEPPPSAFTPIEKVWPHGPILDQNGFPHCVAYAWKQLAQSVPVRQGHDLGEALVYEWCQRNDEWPGEAYDGTSVRAGAKFMQAQGLVSEYRWARDIEDVLWWVTRRGPVVLGTAWFSGMFTPNEKGVAIPSGRLVGGHAYLAVGYEPSWEAVVCVNSWGERWGRRGVFYLWEKHLEWLLSNPWRGEACAPVEVRG